MKKLLCLLLVFMLCGCSIDKRATTKTPLMSVHISIKLVTIIITIFIY